MSASALSGQPKHELTIRGTLAFAKICNSCWKVFASCIGAAAKLVRNLSRHAARPAFPDAESYDLEGVVVLACRQVIENRLALCVTDIGLSHVRSI